MDADRKDTTWDILYKNIYTADDWTFWGLLDFNNRVNGCATFKEKIVWTAANKEFKTFVDNYSWFKISGDADFGNLKSKKCKEYMEDADDKMHSFPNFSLMPCTGGMNCKKWFKYRDKFHRLIYALSKYFELRKNNKDENTLKDYIKDNLLTIRRNMQDKGKRVETIFHFLNFFKDIYDYCEKIYLLSGKKGRVFVDKLIKVGEANDLDLKAYCELAKEYWKIRRQAILVKAEKLGKKAEVEKDIDENINNPEYK